MHSRIIAMAAFIVLSVSIGCGGDASGGSGGAGGASGAGGAGGMGGAGGNGGAGGMGGAGGVISNATVDEGVVLDVAIDAFNAAEIAIGGDGEGGAVELADVGTNAVNIVILPESKKSATVQPKQGEGCECTENSCTFTGCDNGSGLLLEGSISWTENTLDCDYMVSGNQAGTSYSFTIFCDLDYTETSLDGQLDTRGEVEILGGVSMWHSVLMFNNVTYTGGQPTGGSIDVSASVTVNGETHTANGSVSF